MDTYSKPRGFTMEQSVFYGAEILTALQGIHDMGIIYRDLKPENCLIGADGKTTRKGRLSCFKAVPFLL